MKDNLINLINNIGKGNKYKIISNNKDLIELEYRGNKFSIEFESEDLESELVSISSIGDFYIKGKGFLSFILIDSKNCLTNDEIIKVEDCSIKEFKISKEKSDSIIWFSNFEYIVDTEKINLQEKNIISDIIKSNIVLCEVILEDDDAIQIENLINSILMYLSFSKGMLFDNPSNVLKKIEVVDLKCNDKFLVIKDNEPMLYFLIAEKSDFLHYKFLEYYHVLEYYFLEHKVNMLDKMIRELVSERIIGKDLGDDYYHKLNNIYSHFHSKEKKKNADELEELQYVIKEDLGYKIIRFIMESSFEDISFLRKEIFNESETFVDLNSILIDKSNCKKGIKEEFELDEEVKNNFCNSLAKRIYKIRNNIVHTKKYENSKVFTPTGTNIESLVNDLKLVRLISYYLMKNRQLY